MKPSRMGFSFSKLRIISENSKTKEAALFRQPQLFLKSIIKQPINPHKMKKREQVMN